MVFNQIAPDYLEGLLLVMPGEQIEQECVFDISKVAALLHRAADMDHKPTIKETKFLLPKPALYVLTLNESEHSAHNRPLSYALITSLIWTLP